jgi:DNA-binding response OmpR family regulator
MRRKADAGDGQVALARREFALLRRLMFLRGQVATREELLEDVWGTAPDAASNVVDVTVARLRAKLGEDVVETVRHVGYRFCV